MEIFLNLSRMAPVFLVVICHRFDKHTNRRKSINLYTWIDI